MSIFGIGGLFGQVFGGYLGQNLYNREKKLVSFFMGTSTLIGILPMLYVVNCTGDSVVFYLAFLSAGFIISITGPNIKSLLQNVTIPETRGTSFAIFNLTDDLGKGIQYI